MNEYTKFENKKKKFKIPLVIGVLLSILAIFLIFTLNYNRIYKLLWIKIWSRLNLLPVCYKLIQTEIENLLSELEASQKTFLDHDGDQQDEIVEHLKEIKKERQFEKIGVVNLEGTSLDDTGKVEKSEDTEFLDSMKKNKRYVSNVMDVSDTMMIAVPITRNGQVTGAIWGYYSISKISEKIELTKGSQRYFQIIDDTGLYISSSNNVYSLQKI